MSLKSLERAWKRFALGATCRSVGLLGSRPGSIPDWRDGPRRVLFLRQDRIGDAIVSSALLRAIRDVSPDLTVDVLASARNAEILRRDPSVDTVHVYDKRNPRTFPALIRALRARRYDVAIDCMLTAPSMTGLMLMIGSGARHRIGLAGRGIDEALTIPVPPRPGVEHIIDRYAALANPFGVDPDAEDWRPRLPLTDEERSAAERRWGVGRRLLVNVSAGHPQRYWPEERFVEAIRMLRERVPGIRVLVVGSPADAGRVESIAAASGGEATPTPRIGEVIALVATTEVLLTADTSVVHMASAFATPSVVLHRADDARREWGLYHTPGVDLVGGEGLFGIGAERAAEEVVRLLRPEPAAAVPFD